MEVIEEEYRNFVRNIQNWLKSNDRLIEKEVLPLFLLRLKDQINYDLKKERKEG